MWKLASFSSITFNRVKIKKKIIEIYLLPTPGIISVVVYNHGKKITFSVHTQNFFLILKNWNKNETLKKYPMIHIFYIRKVNSKFTLLVRLLVYGGFLQDKLSWVE